MVFCCSALSCRTLFCWSGVKVIAADRHFVARPAAKLRKAVFIGMQMNVMEANASVGDVLRDFCVAANLTIVTDRSASRLPII